MAQTPHPFTDPHLSRDFCENQLEIITPVCQSIDEMMASLKQLDTQARTVLKKQNETLWLYSNPPHIESEADIPVARFDGALAEKSNYRKNLERRYGKRLMLYSGIHFNFSFSDRALQLMYAQQHEISSFSTFKIRTYLRLLKQAIRNSWLLVLLTAASPIYDKSFDEDHASGATFGGYASMRSGKRGYWNQFTPTLDYSSLSAYTDSIQYYVTKGVLFSAGELYLPVRLKPRGENSLRQLRETGPDHIELRMFDLNPLEPLGICQTDLEFAHLWLVYLTSLEDFNLTASQQHQAITWHQDAARLVPEKRILERANRLLNDMKAFFQCNDKACAIIAKEQAKLSGETLCETILEKIRRDSNVRTFGALCEQEGASELFSKGILCAQPTPSTRMGSYA
jgi:glutamate--cysteine ligase